MKKTAIISLTISLICSVSLLAQNSKNVPATASQQNKVISKIDNVTVDKQEITLYMGKEGQKLNSTVNPVKTDNQGVYWSSSSNGTISKVEGGVVTAVSVGIDTVYATSQIDSLKSAKCIIEVKIDSLVWYRNQYQKLMANIGENDGKIISLKQNTDGNEPEIEFSEAKNMGLILNNEHYILASIFILVIIILIIWLLTSKKQAKNKSAKYRKKLNELQRDLKNNSLDHTASHEKTQQLTAEIKKLKDDNTELRTLIYQNQQEQKKDDEPKLQTVAQPQSLSLYADAIIDGKFNRVTEEPDSRSVFELKLLKANDTKANVVIYQAAYARVIANPSFLEGCEKQILGSTTVTLLREGIAHTDSSGKWSLTTVPEVKIS